MKEIESIEKDMYLWTLVARVRHQMLRARQKELAPYNITPRQAHVLRVIHDLGNRATLKDVSTYVFREIHSISAQTSRMEKKGFIKKIRDKPGTTTTRFELTEKGLEVYKSSMKRDSIRIIMSALSEEEREGLSLYLDKILAKSLELSLR